MAMMPQSPCLPGSMSSPRRMLLRVPLGPARPGPPVWPSRKDWAPKPTRSELP
ncbi:hypothetical protein D3C79_683950 [compost metagenome]